MFISSMWDVKEPTHHSKRAGHEVSGVAVVLYECMGGYREGDMPRRGHSVPFESHLALLCKSCIKEKLIIRYPGKSLKYFLPQTLAQKINN